MVFLRRICSVLSHLRVFSPRAPKGALRPFLGRSAPSLLFHGALRNTLLSAGFPVTIHMIALEQMFVNNLSQKIFLADAASESNRFYQ